MASGFADLLADLLAPLGGVSLRKMFGGIGVFKDAIMFGLVDDDVLYLKADDATAPAYEAEGCGRFVYDARGRAMSMPYWRLPDRLYDDADEFRAWAETAFAVAHRTAKAKKPPATAANKAAPKSGGKRKPATKPRPRKR
jgi:DNA transformation protein